MTATTLSTGLCRNQWLVNWPKLTLMRMKNSKKKVQIWNLHSNISRINDTFDQMFTQIRGVRNKNQAYLDFPAHPGFFRPIRIFSVPTCFLLQFPRVSHPCLATSIFASQCNVSNVKFQEKNNNYVILQYVWHIFYLKLFFICF